MTGFSPQKQTLTVYIMPGFTKHEALMKKLGKYKMGKSCLHIKKIEPKDEKGIFSFSSRRNQAKWFCLEYITNQQPLITGSNGIS